MSPRELVAALLCVGPSPGVGEPPSTPPASRASPPLRVDVRSVGCEGLTPSEIARLLDIELSMVTAEIRSGPPLRVELSCEAARMTIAIVDPFTRKRLARDIPAPALEPGRERVVALAISQLFAASWLELLTPDQPPPPPPKTTAPTPDPPAVRAARTVAARRVGPSLEPAPPPPRRELELLVGAGARGRALPSDGRLAAARTELRLRGWLHPALGLVAVIGWDVGQSSRRLGQVGGQVVSAGGGLAWRWRPGRVGVGGHVTAAAGWGRVRGRPREPGVPAGANAGATGDAAVGLGPRIRYGRLRVDVDAQLGGMLRTPVGLVDDGPPMTMGGLWTGLTLRMGGSLR